MRLAFPEGFKWGTATSSYQIEGAVKENGRGESIWDRFSHTPGRIEDGSTGDVACDHYHRWAEDIGLMKSLGLNTYRFSISWPRVIPDGRGKVNQAGLGFYDRLVDGLLEAGITPVPTLYHWDLPMVLQEEGGWVARSTAEAFASYAETVVSHLADRVDIWITINEPWVAAVLGHMEGIHAPGHSSVEDGVAASHHLLLAHGLATQRIRSVAGNAKVGIALNQDFMQPASMHPADLVAADLEDALMNRFFAEPLAGGRYPHEAIEHYRWDQAQVKAGDLQIISEPLDLIGLNYYKRQVVVAAGVEDSHRPPPIINPGPEFTEMGWEVSPTGMVPLIERLHIDNGFPSILITENGAAYPDHADGSGSVDDQDRISYLRRHLIEIHRAIELGLPVQGYLVWSLLDNFEWSLGYTKRFGLVRVDFQTQRRNPKASAGWYRDVVSANAITT